MKSLSLFVWAIRCLIARIILVVWLHQNTCTLTHTHTFERVQFIRAMNLIRYSESIPRPMTTTTKYIIPMHLHFHSLLSELIVPVFFVPLLLLLSFSLALALLLFLSFPFSIFLTTVSCSYASVLSRVFRSLSEYQVNRLVCHGKKKNIC